MSTNWIKYCLTAEACRAKARNPQNNGVLQFIADRMRAVPMALDHTPLPDDRSHVDVVGQKTSAEIRLRMLDVVNLVLIPNG